MSRLLGAALTICVSIGCTDPRQEARDIASQPASCATAGDCCRVYDECMGQVLVVSAADRERVQQLINESPNASCVNCKPLVQVWCAGGRCTAENTGERIESLAQTPIDCGMADPARFSRAPLGNTGEDLATSRSPLILGCGT